MNRRTLLSLGAVAVGTIASRVGIAKSSGPVKTLEGLSAYTPITASFNTRHRHFAIVVDDPEVAHAQEIARNIAANLKANPGATKFQVERAVRQHVGQPKKAGDLHTHLSSACPDGWENCRNCGDPNFAEACKAAGHCPHCGTRHGIAPDAVVKANGYALVEVDPPSPDAKWNAESRQFE
jgi:hypothetical protein